MIGSAYEIPLSGKWHHGNGVLICGTLRIAREDFDVLPSSEFKKELFDWICEVLNREHIQSKLG